MLYVSTACFEQKKIIDIINIMVNHGLSNIELSGGTVYYETIEDDLWTMKQQYNLNYAVHAYFPPPPEDYVINLASCNDIVYHRSLKHYEDCLAMMKRLGSRILSIHAGFLVEVTPKEIGREINANEVYPYDDAMARFCRAYEHIVQKAARENIEVYLENNVLDNHNFENFKNRNLLLMTDYQSIMEVYKRMPFHFLLDLGHLYVSCQTLGLDFEQEVTLLKEYTRWLHISDNNGVKDQHTSLKPGSRIENVLKRIISAQSMVTVESKGSLEEIIGCAKLINSMLEDKK